MSKPPFTGNLRFLHESFCWVIFGGGVLLTTSFTSQPTFADQDLSQSAEAPPSVNQLSETFPGKLTADPSRGKAKSGDPSEEKRPCVDDPVACVPVNITQVPYPGCTSGQRCSLDTSGKQCSMLGQMPVRKCQTINNNGACTCQCIQ